MEREFVPYVDERNHLGQLIDSDAKTALGSNASVKKLIVRKNYKHGDKFEVREDIPRRWLEGVGGSSDAYNQSSRRGSVDGPPNKFSLPMRHNVLRASDNQALSN
jgi:hypothetical protein